MRVLKRNSYSSVDLDLEAKKSLVGWFLLSLQQHDLCSTYFEDLLKKIGGREGLFV